MSIMYSVNGRLESAANLDPVITARMAGLAAAGGAEPSGERTPARAAAVAAADAAAAMNALGSTVAPLATGCGGGVDGVGAKGAADIAGGVYING